MPRFSVPAGIYGGRVMRQLVQVVTARLQHVTFTTLDKLLGLSSELLRSVPAATLEEEQLQALSAGSFLHAFLCECMYACMYACMHVCV